MREEALRTRIMTDPHSPGMYRGYVPLQNVQAFYDAHTLADLARRVVLKEPVVEEKTSPVIGKQTLTPIQHWFFEHLLNSHLHSNHLIYLTSFQVIYSMS